MSAFIGFLKKATALIMIGALFLLSGCSQFEFSADDFIAPPRTGGEMYDIEKALKNSITESSYTLKYPTEGEYRSAYILADLTGGGEENFAMAFYSSISTQNVSTMHLNLMKRVNNTWISISKASVAAVGVEMLEISDLNGDGIKEIAVGWNVYGGLDKKVSVYTLQGAQLVPVMQEPYTKFMCCDLTGDKKEELFLISHDTNNALAWAKYYAFSADAVKQIGNCEIDGTVASFNDPVYGRISKGTPAVFIDAVKGAGMQTEIIYCRGDELVCPTYTSGVMGYVSPTYRNSPVVCLDINSDGFLDIPLTQPLGNISDDIVESDLNQITRWSMFNGNEYTVSLMAVMNYADGYYFEVPSRWQGKITVEISVETRTRTVVLWNLETGTKVSELLKIRTVSENEWDIPDNGFNGYVEISRFEGVVYSAMFSDYNGPEAIVRDEFKKLFHLIG